MPETNFFWDPLSDNILQERDAIGALTAEYTTETGLYGNVMSQNRGGVESQFHFDGLGSTVAVTDENQNVTDTRAYTALGESTEQSGSTIFPFQYVGRKGYYLEVTTSQYSVRRRWFGPQLARWLSRDPIGSDRPDVPYTQKIVAIPYAYSLNRPLLFRDPSGLLCQCCCCIADADIALVSTIVDREVMREERSAHVWGHEFEHIANLDFVPGMPGKCKIEWFECPSRATPQMREKGKETGKWYDAHETFMDTATPPDATKGWLAYAAGEPPFDKLQCPGHTDMLSFDQPQVETHISRVTYFAIRVTSSDDCMCPNRSRSVISFATQILRPAYTNANGTLVPKQQEFTIGKLLPQPELPDCGPLPGRS